MIPFARRMANNSPTTTDWNLQADAIDVAARPPAAVITWLGAAQSATSGVPLTVQFDTVAFDNWGMASMPGSVITILETGLYKISAFWPWNTNATGLRTLIVGVNGTGIEFDGRPSGAGLLAQSITFDYPCTASDQIGMTVNQNSGGALTNYSAGGYPPRLSAVWQSAA